MDNRLREEIIRMHAQLCSGLADTNRIMILYTLNNQESNVSDLAELLNIPQPTVSRHLKILRERGMVDSQRDGQSVVYSVSDQRIIEALDLLREVMADNVENQASLMRSVNTVND